MIHDKSMDALDAHFRQWQKTAEQLRAQLTPSLKIQETLKKSLGPLLEAQTALEKAVGPIISQQNRWGELIESFKVPQFAVPDLSILAEQTSHFQKVLRECITPAFERLQRSFRDLPPRTQEALLLLGDHGWYLDLEMPLPGLWELKEALSEGNVAEAENALAEHFEARQEEIEKSISERFPHRAHLIRAAFNAHRREEYELSIPVLLAQTDGICKELVHQYLFIKRNKKPGTATYVDQIEADTYRAALLSPLAKTLPINASECERPAGSAALNRHTVLHGESLDYGSKINSLKAISLVNYVAHVLEVGKKNP